MDSYSSEIYVQLLNEGTICYRPVPASHCEGGTYLLHGQDLYCSRNEEWEFVPGTTVVVEHRNFEGVTVLVAVGVLIVDDGKSD